MVAEDSAEDSPHFIVLRSGRKIERVAAEDPNEYPDNRWLPNGWTVEFSTIKSGKKSGRKIKSFVDPSTGRRFYSRPQVFRYFKNVKQSLCKSKRKKASTQSTSKVIIETYTVADLPGWIKELKITRNQYRKTRRDPFYTDPVSGYVFRSRKEVDRYLETGEISRHAFIPKERRIKDNTLEPPATTSSHEPLPAAKRLMLVHSGTKQKLNSEELTDANEQSPDVKTVIDNGNESKENPDAKKGMCLSLRSSKRLAGPEPESVPSLPVIPTEKLTEKCLKQNMIEKISESKENSNEKKGMFFPFQSSKQVAGVENMLVTASESRVQAETDSLASSAAVPTEECLKHDVIDNGTESKENSDGKKALCLPLRYSRRLTAIEPELVAASESNAQAECELAASSAVIPTKEYLKQNVSAESKENSNDMNGPCLPLQSSKQLAGLGPELVGASLSSAQAEDKLVTPIALVSLENGPIDSNWYSKRHIRYSRRLAGLESKSCKKETVLAIKATSADKVFQQHEADPRTPLPCQAPNANSANNAEASINSQKSLDNRAIPKEQPQELEADKSRYEKSEPRAIPSFGQFLSNPWRELASKTQTKETPVKNGYNNGLVSTFAADIMHQKHQVMNKIEKSCNNRSLTNSCKSKSRKDLNLPRPSSEQLSGLQLDPMASSISNKCVRKTAVRKSSKAKAQHLKAASHKAPSKNRKRPRSGKLEIEKMNGTDKRPEPQTSFPSGSFWSDPCLQFAFKTLTGEISIDHYLPIQSYFQQQVNASQSQRKGTLKQQADTSETQNDVSLTFPPSFFQSDIDNLEKQPESEPQCPFNFCSFLPSGNVSLPSCSDISFQPPQWEDQTGDEVER